MEKEFVLVAVPVGLTSAVASLIAGYAKEEPASSQSKPEWSEEKIHAVYSLSPPVTQKILKFIASKDGPTTAAELMLIFSVRANTRLPERLEH